MADHLHIIVLFVVIIFVLRFFIYSGGMIVCVALCRYFKKKISVGSFDSSVNNHIQQTRNYPPERNIKVRMRTFLIGYLHYHVLQTGKIHSHLVRNFIYRHIYRLDMGQDVVIYGNAEIRSPFNVSIGKGTIIGNDAKLDGRNGISIGEHVNFSTGVWIWTLQHDPQSPDFLCTVGRNRVEIGDRVWLSCRSIILPGIRIGEGAVVAAGSVVTKDVQPFTIVAGVPAKPIGMRIRNLAYKFQGERTPFL